MIETLHSKLLKMIHLSQLNVKNHFLGLWNNLI